jgi:hypothetical protein
MAVLVMATLAQADDESAIKTILEGMQNGCENLKILPENARGCTNTKAGIERMSCENSLVEGLETMAINNYGAISTNTVSSRFGEGISKNISYRTFFKTYAD